LTLRDAADERSILVEREVRWSGDQGIRLKILWPRRGIENAPGRRQGEVEMDEERMKRHRALPGVRKKSWDDDFTLQSADFKGFDEGTSAERKDSDRRSRNILERRSTSGGLSGQNSGTLRTKGP